MSKHRRSFLSVSIMAVVISLWGWGAMQSLRASSSRTLSVGEMARTMGAVPCTQRIGTTDCDIVDSDCSGHGTKAACEADICAACDGAATQSLCTDGGVLDRTGCTHDLQNTGCGNAQVESCTWKHIVGEQPECKCELAFGPGDDCPKFIVTDGGSIECEVQGGG